MVKSMINQGKSIARLKLNSKVGGKVNSLTIDPFATFTIFSLGF